MHERKIEQKIRKISE